MLDIIFLVAILGACVGSFLNVVIYRLPKKQSIIYERSQCPSCKRKLNVFDLLPIISWIFLKGKCRYCNYSISRRYPFIEFISSVFFILCLDSRAWIDSFSSDLFIVISGWILVSYLIVLAFIDVENMILPNSITYSGSLVCLFLIFYYNYFVENVSEYFLFEHLSAYVFAFVGVSLFSYFVQLVIKKPGIGGGDAKLFAMSGIWLGLEGLEVTVTLSFLISALFVLMGLFFKLIRRGEYIPFGPFICLSIFLVWFYGPQFWIESLRDIFWWKYL